HNLGYQGLFDGDRFPRLGLPESMMTGMTGAMEFYKRSNFLKAGIVLADKVTTVSEQYAREIQSGEEFGFGLEGVLTNRAGDLHGIVNGVDYAVWAPSRDKHLPYRYNLSNLSGKRMTKVELLGKAGLPVRDKVPLVGIITRMASQKGMDLIIDGADELLSMNLQMIALGTGDKEYQDALKVLEAKYPDQLKVYLAFDDALAHRIEAGSDIFLMPSRYEPCGLNQMYSLKYGTVPVVRRVGGLADTVVDYDPTTGEGTGFVFDEYTSEAMLAAVRRAVTLYARRQKWVKLMKAGMRQDYSWTRSAGKYVKLYESIVS
ncbi:MAG: glycogen/starch synthase, partial [candidate division Zixibacteria bacterium]|nr:glycogen/starch synthase [candidate division Zixibacteria bacterium]